MFASFPGHPDVSLAFNTMAGLKVTWPSLLERRAKVAADRPVLLRSRFATLRAGPRVVHGLPGEEIATRVTELNASTVYGFDWEVPGTENDVLLPAIHLALSTGNSAHAGGAAVQSSLHEQAALALWDAILSSVRVRPARGALDVQPTHPVETELGATAWAGSACPETGWWTCADGNGKQRVLGGDRRHLRKGQLMPQALFMQPQTMWQKIRGLQATVESHNPTLWRLTDRRHRQRGADMLPFAPPTPAAPKDPTTLPVAAGDCVQTGAACPTSGWWRCQDVDALDGTRWFSSGVLLPQATFRISVRYAKGAGAPTMIRRRTRWEFVRPAEQPEAGPASA